MSRLSSMRARMTGGFLLVLAPFLFVTCVGLVLVNTRLDAVQTRSLMRQAAVQAKRILTQPGAGWRDALGDLMSRPTLRTHEIGLLVSDRQGHVLWRSSNDLPSRPVIAGDGWEIAVRRSGPLTVLALHPDPARSALRDRLLSELLVLSLCVLLVASFGAWALVGRTLRPIHQLSQQSAAASAEDLEVRLAAPSQDAEIVELVGTLNGLLARQARTAAAKGRFHAAASHELRTPLQALSGHLELALSRPRAAGEYESALREAQGQTQRLIALVRALLLLHQLEGHGHSPQEPTDLTAVCDNALALVRPHTGERGLKLAADIAPHLSVHAVPTHAEILVRNLLENAARYTTQGGRVSVTLSTETGQVRLEVTNDSLLREGDDPHTWLEPFHRPDGARATTTGGNGLGLAICRAVADANGWQLQLCHEAGTVRAMLTVPPALSP